MCRGDDQSMLLLRFMRLDRRGRHSIGIKPCAKEKEKLLAAFRAQSWRCQIELIHPHPKPVGFLNLPNKIIYYYDIAESKWKYYHYYTLLSSQNTTLLFQRHRGGGGRERSTVPIPGSNAPYLQRTTNCIRVL